MHEKFTGVDKNNQNRNHMIELFSLLPFGCQTQVLIAQTKMTTFILKKNNLFDRIKNLNIFISFPIL